MRKVSIIAFVTIILAMTLAGSVSASRYVGVFATSLGSQDYIYNAEFNLSGGFSLGAEYIPKVSEAIVYGKFTLLGGKTGFGLVAGGSGNLNADASQLNYFGGVFGQVDLWGIYVYAQVTQPFGDEASETEDKTLKVRAMKNLFGPIALQASYEGYVDNSSEATIYYGLAVKF